MQVPLPSSCLGRFPPKHPVISINPVMVWLCVQVLPLCKIQVAEEFGPEPYSSYLRQRACESGEAVCRWKPEAVWEMSHGCKFSLKTMQAWGTQAVITVLSHPGRGLFAKSRGLSAAFKKCLLLWAHRELSKHKMEDSQLKLSFRKRSQGFYFSCLFVSVCLNETVSNSPTGTALPE